MTHTLKDLLGDVLKKYRLEPALHKARMPEYWRQTVGERLASISEIRSFEGGVLRVHVFEAAWRTELMLRRDDLRQQLNSLAGGEMVVEIIIR